VSHCKFFGMRSSYVAVTYVTVAKRSTVHFRLARTRTSFALSHSPLLATYRIVDGSIRDFGILGHDMLNPQGRTCAVYSLFRTPSARKSIYVRRLSSANLHSSLSIPVPEIYRKHWDRGAWWTFPALSPKSYTELIMFRSYSLRSPHFPPWLP
jgi:hypothetical protein